MKPRANLTEIESIVQESQAIRQQAARVLRQAEELKTRLEHSRLEMLRTLSTSLACSNGSGQSRRRWNQQP
jgi:hypothetical protein